MEKKTDSLPVVQSTPDGDGIANKAIPPSVVRPTAQKVVLSFVGEVVALGSPWMGRSVAYQSIQFRVLRVLAGKWDADSISGEYPIVYGSPRTLSETHELDPKVVAIGSKWMVEMIGHTIRRDTYWEVDRLDAWSAELEQRVPR